MSKMVEATVAESALEVMERTLQHARHARLRYALL